MSHYKVTRKSFEKAVRAMQEDPNNIENQRLYHSQFKHLAKMLLRKYKVDYKEHEDRVQDLMEITLRRGLPEKVDPKQNAFAFYWTTFSREIWKQKEKDRKDCTYVQHYGIFQQKLTDKRKGERKVLKELGFSLDEYNDIPDIDKLPTVMASKPKRGKPKIVKYYDEYWEDMFNHLVSRKTELAENLVSKLPKEKQELNNPVGACKAYLRKIAEREGYKLTVHGGRVFTLKENS